MREEDWQKLLTLANDGSIPKTIVFIRITLRKEIEVLFSAAGENERKTIEKIDEDEVDRLIDEENVRYIRIGRYARYPRNTAPLAPISQCDRCGQPITRLRRRRARLICIECSVSNIPFFDSYEPEADEHFMSGNSGSD